MDTPGLADNRGTTEDGEEMFMTAIKSAIKSNPGGYHALVLVLRYGNRFTQEDVNTITYLKNVFGENFISKYCILVMTCGDQFKYEVEEGNITVPFEEWCKQEQGYFQEIMQEVKERVVLFDNRGSKEIKDEQRRKLVAMIDRLMLGGRRYTDEKFEKAKKEMEKQIKQKEISKIGEAVQKEISLVLLDLDRVKSKTNVDAQLEMLKDLMAKVTQTLKTIDEEKPATMDLLNIRQVALDAQHQVELEMRSLRTKQELEQKQKASQDTQSKEIEELKKQLARMQIDAQRQKTNLENQYKATRDENSKSRCTIS